jgi:D-inositol-3-phosphate glycosyltransferase
MNDMNTGQNLKIAMLSLHSCPIGTLGGRDTGGMNVYIKELTQELGKRGHIVDIYTREHQPKHEQVVSLSPGVRLIHIETGGDEVIPKVAFYSYLQKFICGVENFRSSDGIAYDVMHSHYWLSGLTGKQLQLWWHIPHMTMFHTLGAVKNSTGIGEEESELRIECEREIAHSCDRIIATTQRETDNLVEYYEASPQMIHVTPCGVNPDLFQPADRWRVREELGLDHQKVLLYVGRIDPLKGIDRLLKALPHVSCDGEVNLLVVGGDHHNQEELYALKLLAEGLNIETQVRFLGAVEQNRLPAFYNAADACIIPSYYESFGMVALESLACGTPVISTNVGDIPNIIARDEAGYVIDDNSPRLIGEKITELLSRKRGAVEIETRRSIACNYGWSTIADAMLDEYRELIAHYSTEVTL